MVEQPSRSLPRATRPQLKLRPTLRPRPVTGPVERLQSNTSPRLTLKDILSGASPSSVSSPKNTRPTTRPHPRLQPRPLSGITTASSTTTASSSVTEIPELEIHTEFSFDEVLVDVTTSNSPVEIESETAKTQVPEISTVKPKFRLTPRPITTEATTHFIISQRPTPSPRQSSSLRPSSSPRPSRPRVTPVALPPSEYEYIYDYVDQEGALGGSLGQLATLTEKAILLPDGSIECYDTGYFPHPESCKKFISCSKTVRGFLLGWTYTCPQELVFDPVGGMCNWTEAVDCQTGKN